VAPLLSMTSSAPARRSARLDLAGHDARICVFVEAAAGLDAFDLERLGDVDDQHAVGEFAC
jgi:hypothetical protein